MKFIANNTFASFLTLLLVSQMITSVVQAQGTAFTYQGQLHSGSSPANGNYNFQFALFNAASGGNQIGSAVTNSTVGVTNGLFTVTMDFGPGTFAGSAIWLQAGVATNGSNNFVTLSPRQPITPTPYAIYAPNAGSAISASSVSAANIAGTLTLAQLPSAVVTNNAPRVTIGGTNPVASLTVPVTLPIAPIGSVSTAAEPRSVVVVGRYAYVANESGPFQIFDVGNPTAPFLVGSVGTGQFPVSIAVAGRYAYVTTYGTTNVGPLQIFDVSNPSAPVSVGSAGSGMFALSVATGGRYTYEAAPNSGSLEIFDVSDSHNPVVSSYLSTGVQMNSLVVAGRYLYIAGNNTLQIYDVSNATTPVLKSATATLSNVSSIAISGRYLYTLNRSTNSLQIMDVSNPANPITVATAATGGSPASVQVADRYAYVLNGGSNSLQVFDVSIPTAPVSIGTIPTGRSPSGLAVSGRYVYVVNTTDYTLQVFDMGGAYIQQLEAGTIETGNLQTRDSLTVGQNLNVTGGLTAGGSALITGGLSINGSVGIGISPATNFALQVNGSVAGVGAYNNISDARYKTNITELTHALEKVMALRGVEYIWRSNAFPQVKFDGGLQLGFIAQEISEVLPEVVSQNGDGYYSIAYSKVIPVLAEAIKEQQKELAERNHELQELKQRLDRLERMVDAAKASK